MHPEYETLFVSAALRRGIVSAGEVEECLLEMEKPGAPARIGALLRQKGYMSEAQFREISEQVFSHGTNDAGAEDDVFAYICLKKKLALGYHVLQFREARRTGAWPGPLKDFLISEGIITADQARDAEAGLPGMMMECPRCGAGYAVPAGAPAGLCCPECDGVFRPPDSGMPAGCATQAQQLIGGYEIEAEIGRGAMGLVFRAKRSSDGLIVALKTMPSAGDDGLAERFRREAELAAHLRHPSIVPVIEIGEAGGALFIAMEYVRGRTLESLISRQELTIRSSAGIIADAAAAVHFAHRQGVIHRDIKPGNIMVDCEGRVRICDFGLAKQRDIATITASGTIVGTPMYMSPEQATPGAAVDFRTDIYSLGATLYEAVTGRPPFSGRDVNSLIRKVKDDDPQSPGILNPSLPRGLERVINKAMEKSPRDRYSFAGEMADDLRSFLAGGGVKAAPPAIAHRISRFARRRAEGVFVLLLSLAIAVIMAGILLRHRGSAEDPSSAESERAQLSRSAFAALRMRSYEEAAGLYGAMIDAGTGGVEARLYRGIALRELGRFEEALSDFRAARELDPGNARPWMEEGLAQLGAGRLDEARRSFAECAARDPGSAAAWIEAGRACSMLGRSAEAAAAFERALAAEPGNQTALLGMLDAQLALFEEAEAMKVLAGIEASGMEPARVSFERGRAALMLGDPGSAAGFFRKADDPGGDGRDLRRLALAARLGTGVLNEVRMDLLERTAADIALGKAEDALASIDAAAEAARSGRPPQAPGTALDGELQFIKARVLSALGRRDDAMQAFSGAVSATPGRWDLILAAARVLVEAGGAEEAEKLMKSALAAARPPAGVLRIFAALRGSDSGKGDGGQD